MKSNQSTILGRAPDTPGRLKRLLDRWRGHPRAEYDLTPYLDKLSRVNAYENDLRAQDDVSLRERAGELRLLLGKDPAAPELEYETYALVRESARRVLDMRHFDVQIVGGMVLSEGKLAEMQTGEGKTLVAVLAAVLSVLKGTRVHVLTFNDYLARRDANWMGPIYDFLGVNVAHVTAGKTMEERRLAYKADVTYLPAKEAGFDYLRDGLCFDARDTVHQGFPFAIVDEADSILIDEARIPLVIAGNREEQPHNATRLAAVASGLEPAVHYETDENGRNVFLTEQGLGHVEAELGCGSLHEPGNTQWLTEINLALHARELLTRDVDYIVRDGVIELVDEFTGRVVKDRHWPDGLQTALEAKEGLRFRREGEVLGTVTLQHFFDLYEKLSGMTATARPEEEELAAFYGLRTVVLPPNRPCLRRDLPDRIFTHREAKNHALVGEIKDARDNGRAVLVGTASVRESEDLATRLRETGVECEVLNAKTDALEAKIIAEAGAPGAVTISTNMAGRGTDIRLGGADERERDKLVATGGLYVIGTNRHESRRIDRQLRGRAGRQGDPGVSEFFISFEDDILVRYGVSKNLPERHRRRRDEPLDEPLVNYRIDWAQRVIEGQNFDIRRTLWNYASFIEQQRRIIRDTRDGILSGDRPSPRWETAFPRRYARMLEICGRDRAEILERRVSLHYIDRCWAEHLNTIAQLRESIHMVRLGNKDPLPEFLREADEAFKRLLAGIDKEIRDAFERLDMSEEGLSIERLGLRGPSSTWTYLVDDNPFRDALQLHVGGDVGMSLGAAMLLPFYVATTIYKRYFK